jgi:predicted permease
MTLLQDLKFAIRLLVKDKWFTAVAAMALALGIGVNATVFTFVNAVLIRGLPINEPDRVMVVGTRDARGRDGSMSYLDFTDYRAATRTFSGLSAYSGSTMNVSDEGRAPERFQGPYISGNAFRLIGQRPLLGRDFLPEDDRPGATPVVILGNGVWKNRYGSDTSVIGRMIKVNDMPSIVIGIMPEGFKFPNNADLWLPLAQFPQLSEQKRDARGLEAFGHLAKGVTREQAQSELNTIAAKLRQDFANTNKDITAAVMTFNERMNGGQIRLVFLSLMGAVAFVLLIACANVANLLLARSAARAREMSVRVSLGASRWRIVRQLLVESVLLSILSGVLGLGLAYVGVRLFDAATFDNRPYWIQFTMDTRVVAFFAAVCLGTGIIFGLAPALHASKADVNDVLKDGGRSGSSGMRARRWTSVLIVGQLALTLVLLAGAGLMMKSFLTLYRLDLGIETAHLLTMRLNLPLMKYPQREPRAALYQHLEERLRGVSAIQASALTTHTPLQGGLDRQLFVDGRPEQAGVPPPSVTVIGISGGYFETLRLPIVRGRAFSDLDGTPGHESAIVNQRLATMHFAGADPIGRRIRLVDATPRPFDPSMASMMATIVGVVPSVRQRNFQEPDPDPVVYVPYRADAQRFMTLLVRAPGDPASITSLVREEMRALEPDLPLFGIQTMDQQLAQQRWAFRVFGSMFAIFAAIALALSAVGLYAVTAYSVAQRTQEIGVRMALGAQAPQVWWLVLRRAIVQMAIGLGIGIGGAIGVGKLLESLLVQTGTRDPATLTSIVALLIIVSLAACFWPARRATRLDPVSALRYE